MSQLSRRETLAAIGGTAVVSATLGARLSEAAPPRSGALAELTRQLAAAPRRRGFATVPFMIDRMDLWDHEASAILLAYAAGPKQVWEASDIAAAWPNLMREAVNGQVFAHGHRDFLAVSATHGNAHLALFAQTMWDKYDLASLTGGKFARNEFLIEHPGVTPGDDRQKVDGYYGPANNNIVTLQKRGVVFVACHDSVHAIARGLQAKMPSGAPSADAIAADLTNNLIPGVILVPSVVAYLAEIQGAGFTYAKAA